jgi:ferric-dicitrate binding protein FerR (iron transport regulator)
MKYLMSLFIAQLLIINVSCAKKPGEVSAKINLKIGRVLINGKENVKKGDSIKYGDIIETGSDGACEILVEEKTLLRLKKKSRLVFNLSKENNNLKLERGWLAGITRNIFTKQKKYIIRTSTVTAAVRGTSYCVKVENDKNTYFCVCNGTINLTGEGKEKGEEVTAAHHSAMRFSLDKNGELKIDHSPGMLYHGDKLIEEMAAKIGEKVDWKKGY